MTTELDLFPVSELGDRYQLKGRSNVYNRMDYLGIKAESHRGRAYLNADQLAEMDALHQHISSGGKMSDFPTTGQDIRQITGQFSLQQSVLPIAGQQDLSHETTLEWHQVMDKAEAIAFRLVLAIADKLPQPDPLHNLQQLERAYQNGWLLSTSQLAPLLGVKGLSGKAIERFGFRCVRVGRNGAESAWKLEKIVT